jgi:hypothetical protein
MAVPLAQAFADSPDPAPQALVVSLGWTLRQARHFRIAYEIERQSSDDSVASVHETLTLHQLETPAPIFSFMPFQTDGTQLFGLGGNNEEDAVGRAAFMMVVPSPREGEDLTVRVRVIFP